MANFPSGVRMRFPGCGSAWNSPVSNSFKHKPYKHKKNQYNINSGWTTISRIHAYAWCKFLPIYNKTQNDVYFHTSTTLTAYTRLALCNMSCNFTRWVDIHSHNISSPVQESGPFSYLLKITYNSNINKVTHITCSALWQFLPINPTGRDDPARGVLCVGLWNNDLGRHQFNINKSVSSTIESHLVTTDARRHL